MALHKITKGLNLPIAGAPDQTTIAPAPTIATVAVVAADYIGMKPTMFVKAGDAVKRGQALFEDKKTPGVLYTAPGAGEVLAVHRGDRRALQSVVIRLNDAEKNGQAGPSDSVSFSAYTGKDPAALTGDEVKALLLESGLWTALRTRPFSKVANPATTPHAVFITAIDTNPLAPDVALVLKGNEEAFRKGLVCLAKLTTGKTYLCTAPGSTAASNVPNGVTLEEFEGVHPAGSAGVHIHLLDPVHMDNVAWHLNYQDVIAIGKLASSGKLDVTRVITLAGPSVKKPRLLKTRLGAATDELVRNELKDGDNRVISGSVLSGRTVYGEIFGYLGRYHLQISALPEGHHREFLGWLAPGKNKFSVVSAFVSACFPKQKFEFTTATNGSPRAMVPIGVYERVMPMDIIPTFLLRALLVGDVELATQLGCLELDEEDLALCTFVCPSKYNYGTYLRTMLNRIEKEG